MTLSTVAVDDEELVRKVLRETLILADYTVLEARTAGEAVVLTTNHDGRIDLLPWQPRTDPTN